MIILKPVAQFIVQKSCFKKILGGVATTSPSEDEG